MFPAVGSVALGEIDDETTTYLLPTGIAGAEAFGSLQVSRNLIVGNIASAEAFGTISIGEPAHYEPASKL